jgi:integrase
MLADGYKAQHSTGAAVRYVRPILKWGATRGYLSPEVAVIHLPTPVRRRKRILTRDELVTLLPAFRASTRPYAAAPHFMLLTIAGREEVALARWHDVDMTARTRIIPESKIGEPHTVLPSRQAAKKRAPRRSPGKVGTARKSKPAN